MLSPPKTEEELFLDASRTFQMMRKHMEAVLRPAGLTLSEYMLLRVADAVPHVTASGICSVLYATAPTVAHTVAGLEHKKLITRNVDAKDARRHHIKLTAAGRRIVTRCKKDINAYGASLGIKPALIASAGRELERFREKLGRESAAA